ncbi:MAG: AMP-binding protein [Azonexus sp.]|nr:AMP-binding protein [Azonexus sp.]
MNKMPLLGHSSLDDIFAWRPSGPVKVRQFLAEARALAKLMPAGQSLLNVCQDRYRFALGFVAGLLTGKTSLQPSSQSAETLRNIRQQSPDVWCLCDDEFDSLDLLRLDFPDLSDVDANAVQAVPEIAADHVAACLFTSGSTGTPMPHFKRWDQLVMSGQAEAERLGLTDRPHVIVGTVPVQHAFGFESTFLLALHGAAPFWSGKPFYPQDIVATLNAVPQPRLLVTTPYHLGALLAAEIELPKVDLLLSATAPLSIDLATRAESRFQAPLIEIFGSTETGQIATRQPTTGAAWHLLPGVRLTQEDAYTTASGAHVEGEITLSDVLELLPDNHFLLHGRHADLVNIAGKRTSIAYLNHQITAIPGVIDAAFFLPDDNSPEGITRLCAFVVAPGLNSRELLTALRDRIEPLFLPRPLFFVAKLPRNSTGKLPRNELQALYAEKLEHAGR